MISPAERAGQLQNRQQGIRRAGALPVLRMAGFVGDSIVDGPGLRCAIFCQGCPHACPGCHNPATHPFAGGTMVTPEDMEARIREYPLCRGVTFSGGEPFCQPEFFAELGERLRRQGYELACYTGYTFEALLAGTPEQRRLLNVLDILIDGRFVLAQRNLTLRFRGSENQRVLDVPKSLLAGKAVWTTQTRWVGEDAPV